MVMMQIANLIQTPNDYFSAKSIFEEAINFQIALVKRDQSILRNKKEKKEESQVSTNYCD